MQIAIGRLARFLKVDPKEIRVSVEKGLVTRRPDGAFDFPEAVDEYRMNVLAGRTERMVTIPKRQEPEEPPPDLEIPPSSSIKTSDFAVAKAAGAVYEAEWRRMRNEREAGRLAPVADLQAATYKQMRIVRDACLNLPARISAQLAIETDEHKIYQLLEDELISIFADYAEGRIDAANRRAS